MKNASGRIDRALSQADNAFSRTAVLALYFSVMTAGFFAVLAASAVAACALAADSGRTSLRRRFGWQPALRQA